MKSLACLLLFASVVTAQLPPQAPSLSLPPQAPEVIVESAYTKAVNSAIADNKWLMVFVGCKSSKEVNYVTVEVPTLESYKAPCIILARPENGSMYYHSTIQEARAVMSEPFCST